MIKFDHLRIPVTDLARSRDWYVRTLGLTVEFEVSDRQTVALQDTDDFTIFLQEVRSPVVPNQCARGFVDVFKAADGRSPAVGKELRPTDRDRPGRASTNASWPGADPSLPVASGAGALVESAAELVCGHAGRDTAMRVRTVGRERFVSWSIALLRLPRRSKSEAVPPSQAEERQRRSRWSRIRGGDVDGAAGRRAVGVQADEIKSLTATVIEIILKQIGAEFERATGHTIKMTVDRPELQASDRRREMFDVALFSALTLDLS